MTADEVKAAVPDDLVVPNYNAECYLPLYREARHDALTLAARYPGRYLTTRQDTLVLAYDTTAGCASDPCTWMDRLYQPLLGKVDGTITMYDWNLHLFGADTDTLDVSVSMVLVVASAAAGLAGRRGGLAAGPLRVAAAPRVADRRAAVAGGRADRGRGGGGDDRRRVRRQRPDAAPPSTRSC